MTEPFALTEPAAPGTGMAAVWHPNGTDMNIFYVGQNSQIWSWWLRMLATPPWVNSMLGSGVPAGAGSGLTAAWDPQGINLHVWYVGQNGQMCNWHYADGLGWLNQTNFPP